MAYLDPVEDVDVLPTAFGFVLHRLVLGHLFAGRELNVHLDLGRAPVFLQSQVEITQYIIARFWQRLRDRVAPLGLHSSPARRRSPRLAAVRRRELASRQDSDIAPLVHLVQWLAGRLLEEQQLPPRILPSHAAVVRPVLGRLGDENLELVDLDFGQGRELEGYGDLGADGERLPRNDDIVMELIFPLPADGDGLAHLQGHLVGKADDADFLSPVEVRLEGARPLDRGLQLPLDRGVLELERLQLVVVDRELEGVFIRPRIEHLEALGVDRVGRGRLPFAETPRLDRLEGEPLELLRRRLRLAVQGYGRGGGRYGGRGIPVRTLEQERTLVPEGRLPALGHGVEESQGLGPQRRLFEQFHLHGRDAFGPLRPRLPRQLQHDGLDLDVLGYAELQLAPQESRRVGAIVARMPVVVEAGEKHVGLGKQYRACHAAPRSDGLVGDLAHRRAHDALHRPRRHHAVPMVAIQLDSSADQRRPHCLDYCRRLRHRLLIYGFRHPG